MKLYRLFIIGLLVVLSACAPTKAEPAQFLLEPVISEYDAEMIEALILENQAALDALVEYLGASQYLSFDCWYEPSSGVYQIDYFLTDAMNSQGDSTKSLSKYWSDIIPEESKEKFDQLNLAEIIYVDGRGVEFYLCIQGGKSSLNYTEFIGFSTRNSGYWQECDELGSGWYAFCYRMYEDNLS